MRIQVAYVAEGVELLISVDVPVGASVGDALRSAAIEKRTDVVLDTEGLAVFGRRVDTATPLRDGDRIEITRPLLRDPKTARRDRAAATVDRRQSRRGRRSGI